MRPRTIAALTGAAAVACALAVTAPAQAQQSEGSPSASQATPRPDNRPGPKTAEQAQKRAKALALLRNGKAELVPQKGGGSTVTMTNAEGETESVYFPTAADDATTTDSVFTILAEFGTEGSGRFGTTPGPVHNAIPEPDRTVDNSTYWVEDFSTAHYEELFNGDGESFKNYYLAQSGGKYTALNAVTDWVTVPGNASSYGDNAVEDAGGSWAFIADAADAWYAEAVSGKSEDEVKDFLAKQDTWDRYDFDEDGKFNEPDGYVDHFQAVHAGEGEEAGGGEDAIWSHRWYVNSTDYGTTGPTVTQDGKTVDNLYGGTQIGDSGIWIGDYTVEPENGGLGVFAHEFGHDLDLPDFYDTAGGENGSAFWTLMSSGSWLGHGAAAGDGIGTTPGGLGPEEKLFLGWLDHVEVEAGKSGEFTLSPSERTVDGQHQAVKVNLPNSTRTDVYTTPAAGDRSWWSGRGDGLNTTLTRTVPVGAGDSVLVTADLWYDIEAGYDYLYAEYSTNGGANWTQVGRPVTGSGTRWAGKRWSFKPGVEGDVLFRFRYATDGGVNEAGAFLDSIVTKVGRTVLDTEGAEGGDSVWTADGWKVSTGTEVTNAERYYLIENRQYVGFDETLESGPYQFSEAYTRPDWVEFFSYQPGMLVWLVDQGYTDNNVSEHPRSGYALPVDARPDTLTYPDGTSPSNRREPFDAVFGLDALREVCLHKQVATKVKGKTVTDTVAACNDADGARDAIPSFDDSDPLAYWDEDAPQNSVEVAGVGVTATVTGAGDDGSIRVAVDNSAQR
ncbi:immune inhibitor A [Fodinibacter luteus]|uniref:Immune inhibitor A n=1 Tax=Fodinibacter luteus TaxID=552064 RepID=A0ABP8KBJ1_9MICO